MKATDLLTDKIILETLQADKGTVKFISWSTNVGDIKLGANNFFNVVERFTVKYEENGKEESVNYMAKLNPCKGVDDECNPYRHRAMVKEKFFYFELLPVLNKELAGLEEAPLKVPRCFYATVENEKEVIVFEDLNESGFVNIAKGKQIDEAHTIVMMKELAKLHAASIELRKRLGKDLIEVYPLLLETWMVGVPELRDGFANLFTKGSRFNAKLASVLPEYEHMVKWLNDIAPKGMDIILENLQAPVEPWRIICHADYHYGNVMFKYDATNAPVDVMILDWQTFRVVHLASEIQYMAFSSYFSPGRQDIITLSEDIYFEALENIFTKNNLTAPFTKTELREKGKSNHFSLFLCFFLLPLSICVAKPEDLFSPDMSLLSYTPDVYLKMFEEKENLKFILVEYLDEIKRRNLLEVYKN